MKTFTIDEKGILWVLVEGTQGYACTYLPCEEGKEQEVWDSIPDGTVFQYPEYGLTKRGEGEGSKMTFLPPTTHWRKNEMKAAVEYIAKRVPAISAEYKSDTKHDRHGVPFYRLTYADIQMPPEINTGFKRMYHSADVFSVKGGRFSVTLSLRWETLHGGENGVTIFNEFIE